MTRFFHLITASLLLAAGVFATGDAIAGPLDEAKAQGLIGEQADGYVGPVEGAGGAKELIDEINAARKAKYGEIAAKRGASPEDVAKIAGKKLIGRTPPGQYVRGSDGNWVQK